MTKGRGFLGGINTRFTIPHSPNAQDKFDQILSSSAPLTLDVQLLSSRATLPRKATPGSAGYDIIAASEIVISPGKRAVIPADIAIACPRNTYTCIAPRYGLAIKKGILVAGGVVDSDYRGNVGVILFNQDQEQSLKSNIGDRIA